MVVVQLVLNSWLNVHVHAPVTFGDYGVDLLSKCVE